MLVMEVEKKINSKRIKVKEKEKLMMLASIMIDKEFILKGVGYEVTV